MIEKACDKSVATWEMEKSFKDKKGGKKELVSNQYITGKKIWHISNGKQNSIEEN